MSQIRVFAFGTFDGFHAGHRYYLKQAKSYGNHLTVVIARDPRVEKLKGRQASLKEDARRQIVEQTALADRVILGGLGDPLEIFKTEQIDVAVLGFDQKVSEDLVRAAAVQNNQLTKVIRARPLMPAFFQNHVLKDLGWMGRLLRRTD